MIESDLYHIISQQGYQQTCELSIDNLVNDDYGFFTVKKILSVVSETGSFVKSPVIDKI